MERRWHTPDEPWPRHSKPWWEDTVQRAKAAGWHFMPLSGHSWGRLACDPTLEQPCKQIIFSTGRGGESAAQETVKLIRRCPHTTARSGEPLLQQATDLLEGAEMLLDSADRCLRAHEHWARVEELLALAEMTTDEAEQLLERAVESEEDAKDALGDAYRTGLPVAPGLPYPPQPVDLLSRADEHISDVEGLLADTVADPSGRSLVERTAQARARHSKLAERARSLGNATE